MRFKPFISILFVSLLLLSAGVFAQTTVTGNVSGTWNTGGAPYLLIDDCTVQTGESLIIEPGVEIIISDSKSLNVYGKISAVGTASQHITFRAVNSSVKFNKVYVINGSSAPPVSEFKYCDFTDSQIGLYLHAYGRIDNAYTTLKTIVSNCNYDSSVSTGIYVRAQAKDASQYMTPKRRHAKVSPTIDGCTFNGNGVGIEMYTQGAGSIYYSTGNTAAIIQNNIFMESSGAAISMLPGSLNRGTPFFVNNTIVDCERGIWIQDGDFNAITINNIFYGTTTAIERTGSNSSITYFNCFYDNTVDFVGYPPAYGDIVLSNANGDPCDMGFNIFQDPLFEDAQFHLASSSPCIEAGKDSIEVSDVWYYAPDHDLIGNPRPMPVEARPDMGAWETDYHTSIDSDREVSIPASYKLSQNYPNPFNPMTTIDYSVVTRSQVTISIYSILGREINTILNEEKSAGNYSIQWNGEDSEGNRVASGIYFYQIKAGDFINSKKMLMLK